MNVKDLKDEYLGRHITVSYFSHTYPGILVRDVNPGYAFVSVSDYWVRRFFNNDVIEFVE